MTALQVHTARIGHQDPDVLDVTRKTADPHGVAFAPSWDLLAPYLERRKANALTWDHWTAYATAYRAEMKDSYRQLRHAWEAVLARGRVVFTCFCVDPDHCHRRLLAGFFTKLGAVDGGELHPDPVRLQVTPALKPYRVSDPARALAMCRHARGLTLEAAAAQLGLQPAQLQELGQGALTVSDPRAWVWALQQLRAMPKPSQLDGCPDCDALLVGDFPIHELDCPTLKRVTK